MTGTSDEDLLDLSGYRCPIPVLKAQRRLRSLPRGALLRLVATDPASAIDVPHFCREQGHELLSSATEDDRLVFVIRKGSAEP